jgi:hypothetical protein
MVRAREPNPRCKTNFSAGESPYAGTNHLAATIALGQAENRMAIDKSFAFPEPRTMDLGPRTSKSPQPSPLTLETPQCILPSALPGRFEARF